MVLGANGRICKWIFFTSSICYGVFGLALAITGAVLLGYSWTRKILQIAKLNDETDFTELTDILSVVTGICMLAVGVLGIIASWLEDKTLHFIHGICGVVLTVFEFVLVFIALYNTSRQGSSLRVGMRTFLDNDYDGGITGTSQNWNGVQVYLDCCGVLSRGDYLTSSWLRDLSPSDARWRWPRTCCTLVSKDSTNPIPLDEEACRQGSINMYYHTQGCYDAVRDWVITQGSAIGAVTIIFMIIEIVLVILDLVIWKDLTENEVEPLF